MTTLTFKQVENKIKTVATKGASFDALVQEVALAVIFHVNDKREASLANKLYAALPKGTRRNALVKWFMTFGEIKLNQGADRKDIPLLFKKKGEYKPEEATETMWNDMTVEKSPAEEFNPAKLATQLLNKLNKAVQEGKVAANDEATTAITKALRDALQLNAIA